MTDQDVFITIDWQEQSILDATIRRKVWKKKRKVCTPNDYPQKLPCSNPECQDGGFEIGDKIAALLTSGKDSEQNSLICRNAVHEDKTKRCVHTIIYSIACIRPYQRERSRSLVSDSNAA